MRKTLILLIGILVASPVSIRAQSTLNIGQIENLFSAHAASTGDGTAFALPSQNALTCTWQSSFSSAPASITLQLKTSNDNSTYATVDTSTSVSSEARTFTTSARFVNARINAVSGGSGISVTIVC